MSIDEVNVNSLASRFEERLIINHEFLTDLVTTVTVQVRDKDLFRFDYDHQSLENTSDECSNDLGKIFEISGLYEVDFEFTTNNRVGLRSNNDSYFSGDNRSVTKKMSTVRDYKAWFKQIFDCFSGPIHLIPDTNFLLRCYYSSYLKNIVLENSDKVSMVLSRLTLYEIERWINEKSENIKVNKKSLTKDKNKDKQNEIKNSLQENEIQKRLGLQTIGEVIEIMKDGASIIPNPSNTLLNSFPKASGSSFADSWIRMEISEYERSLQNGSSVDIIFLTSDLLNALMSVAENISTIYIHNKREFRRNNKDMNKLLYTTANYFGECDFIIGSNKTSNIQKYELKGIWEGKTTDDWSNKKVDFNITS